MGISIVGLLLTLYEYGSEVPLGHGIISGAYCCLYILHILPLTFWKPFRIEVRSARLGPRSLAEIVVIMDRAQQIEDALHAGEFYGDEDDADGGCGPRAAPAA